MARFRALGVDVYLGDGRFAGGDVVEVGGQRLTFARAVITTGARAARLPVPGLDTIDYLTNENVFWLTELPPRLVVLGAGPIGCELGQAFRRFGSRGDDHQPEIFCRRKSRTPPQSCRPASGATGSASSSAPRFAASSAAAARRWSPTTSMASAATAAADQLLLGAGRAPNVEGLGLEQVGVECSHAGRQGRRPPADDESAHLRRRRRVLALPVHPRRRRAGPHRRSERAVLRPQADERAAHPVVHLHHPGGRARRPQRPRRSRGRHRRGDVHRRAQDVDRAVLDGETDGFARAVVRKGTDQLVGLTIVATHAGEMIGEAVLAMNHGIGLGSFANTIHPYPTQAEALRKLGDAYNRTRLTPVVKRVFERLLAWRR